MKRQLWRMLARGALAASFGGTWFVARLLARRRSRSGPTGRLLVTGTFYNRGWFLSHMEPLSRCGANEVIVVTDVQQPAPADVRVVTPTRESVRWLGRAGAKLLLMLRTGREYPADVCMGYHIFPGALTALIVARLLGVKAVYQMTGGPIEVAGGGYQAENVLMSKLGSPSPQLEKLALAVIRQFDLVIVRGEQARHYLADRGVQQVSIITGSVGYENGISTKRSIDLIFVGRLSEIKQPEQFVEIVARLAMMRPDIKAVMVGGGPELNSLQDQAARLGVRSNIEFLGQREDVADLLRQSKVFVLTSRSEGLSIAMIEAMNCGVPVVAADVGELASVVRSGVNGWLLPGHEMSEFVRRSSELLDDESRWQSFSQAARTAARELSGVDNVANRWRACLQSLSARPVVQTT
jgi:L-malate glycosyltransferase